MSSPEGATGNGKGSEGKDAVIVKVAGAVIATGIAWGLFKSLSARKDNDKLVEEYNGSSIGESTAAKDLDLDNRGAGKRSFFFGLGKKTRGKATSKLSEMYEIDKGDTLYGISRKYGISVEALKAANGLHGDDIYAGDKLIIPN